MTDIFTTDNLFKYIFTLGSALIIMSLYYFNTSRYDADIESLNLSYEHEILMLNLEREIRNDSTEYIDMKHQYHSDSLKLELSSLQFPDSNFSDEKIELLNKAIGNTKLYEKLNDERQIKILKSQLKSDERNLKNFELSRIFYLTSIGLVVGFFLLVLGGYFWWSSIYIDEINKSKTISKTHKSAFVLATEKLKHTKLKVLIFCIVILVIIQLVQIDYLFDIRNFWRDFDSRPHSHRH